MIQNVNLMLNDRILAYKSAESKITEFGLEFTEKSRFEIEVEIRSQNLIKTKIKTTLNLIYDSKCKFNAK